METLEYIVNKYQLDTNDKRPIGINHSRWKEFPLLLKELGFKKGVEIGSYKGQYAETLMRAIPDLDLTAVDAWTVYKGYKDYGNNDLETVAYEEAKVRSERSGFKILRAWSLDAVKEFEDESLDFVFIDANHDFRHVTDDVDEWSKKVRKGGIVSGHDFFRNHHKGFGVREAIPAYCSAYDIKPLFIWKKDHCPSWMYVKS
jgi:predicted O-methyltransferase YrrM